MRATLGFLAALLTAAAAWGGASTGATISGASMGPDAINYLIVICDDCNWEFYDQFAPSSSSNLTLPNVDALAAEGVSFSQFHADKQCTPTRLGLISMRYGWKNGELTASGWDAGNDSWFADFEAAHPGAYVFGVGKMGNMVGTATGFDYANFGGKRWIGRSGNFIASYDGNGQSVDDYERGRTPSEVVSNPHAAGDYANESLLDDWATALSQWRTEHPGQPFLGILSANSVHFSNGTTDQYHRPSDGAPWDTCPVTDEQCIAAMMEETLGFDWMLGQALSQLTANERLRTCVIVINDNGGEEYFDQVANRAKGSMYGAAARAGMIVSGRACVSASNFGTTGTAGLQVHDIGPTVAELDGFALTESAPDGASFASLLSADCGAGGCDAHPTKSFIITQTSASQVRIAYEDGSYSLVMARDAATSELYHYASDLYEQTDACAGNCATASLNGADDAACQALANFADSKGVLSATLTCGGS